MCPNCILNQAGLQPGIYVAFGICFLFFVMACFGMYFAFKNGDFEDLEGSKFDMLDDGDNSPIVEQARARMEQARIRAQAQASE